MKLSKAPPVTVTSLIAKSIELSLSEKVIVAVSPAFKLFLLVASAMDEKWLGEFEQVG
jgi:hypothetical protein